MTTPLTSTPPPLRRRTTRIANDVSFTAARNSLISGYVAGSIGIAFGHPLDSLKVKLQTQAVNYIDESPPLQLRNAASRLKSLYAGIGPPLVTVGLLSSVNFTIYDSSRRHLFELFPSPSRVGNGSVEPSYLTDDSFSNIALASLCSGFVVSLLSAPVQAIKVLQQVRPDLTLKESVRRIYSHKPSSVRNFFIGYPVHFVAEAPGRTVYFLSYEVVKRKQCEARGVSSLDATLSERIAAAVFSGVTCWASIYPFDCVRSQMLAHEARFPNEASPTCRKMATTMYREHGIGGFTRGFGLTVLRAGPVASVVLPIFDYTFAFLEERR